MKKSLLALALFASGSAHAGLELSNCLIAEPMPGSSVTGIFFDIRYNLNDEIKRLRLPGNESIHGGELEGLAHSMEIHQTLAEDGVMKMRQVSTFPIKAPNVTYHFVRGGHHMMIRDFSKRPVAGEEYKLTLWSTYIDEPTCMAKVVKYSEIPMKKPAQKQ